MAPGRGETGPVARSTSQSQNNIRPHGQAGERANKKPGRSIDDDTLVRHLRKQSRHPPLGTWPSSQ
jgi:hypothetical protein